jgi:hypothetical protein
LHWRAETSRDKTERFLGRTAVLAPGWRKKGPQVVLGPKLRIGLEFEIDSLMATCRHAKLSRFNYGTKFRGHSLDNFQREAACALDDSEGRGH